MTKSYELGSKLETDPKNSRLYQERIPISQVNDDLLEIAVGIATLARKEEFVHINIETVLDAIYGCVGKILKETPEYTEE